MNLPSGWLIYTDCAVDKKGKRQRMIRNIDETCAYFDALRYLIDSRTLNGAYPKKYSRKLIEKYHIRFEDMVPAEDFIFSLRYVLHCKELLAYNEAIYMCDKSNENSITRSRKYGLIDVYPRIFDRAFDLVENSNLSSVEKDTIYRSLDKLHTDSFATCVMEELKDTEATQGKILKRIRALCSKFYSQYPDVYGYKTLTHFCIRFCIRYRLALPLFYFGKLYMNTRK